MMIHTSVDNAIKHGLIPKDEGGEIIISIKRSKKGTQISIRVMELEGANLRMGKILQEKALISLINCMIYLTSCTE